MTIAYKIIESSARDSAKGNIVYCDNNNISIIYVNFNTAQLRVRKQ